MKWWLLILLYLYYRCIYLNHSKSTQSAAGLKLSESFEACCKWVLFNVQIITLLFSFTVQMYIYPLVSKVHAGSFCVSVNPSSCDMDYRIFNVRTWSFLCVRIDTRVWHTNRELAQHFWLRKTRVFCDPDGIQTAVLWIWVWRCTNWATHHPNVNNM